MFKSVYKDQSVNGSSKPLSTYLFWCLVSFTQKDTNILTANLTIESSPSETSFEVTRPPHQVEYI